MPLHVATGASEHSSGAATPSGPRSFGGGRRRDSRHRERAERAESPTRPALSRSLLPPPTAELDALLAAAYLGALLATVLCCAVMAACHLDVLVACMGGCGCDGGVCVCVCVCMCVCMQRRPWCMA